MVARDKIVLKPREKIDLYKLYGLLKNNKKFWVNGDPSMEIETFNKLTISFPQGNFLISYKGEVYFHKIISLDFFIKIKSFQQGFYSEFVRACIIKEIAPKTL